jgi:DNA-binding transcriptional LysR family regulator
MDQLRAIRVFLRVVSEGSFAAAARALDLAPAVVTRAVAELEAQLGTRLLQRTTRRIALTEDGAAYRERVQRIVAELDDANAAAGASTRDPAGTLRVLCPPAFAAHQLAARLPHFRQRCPRVDIELTASGPVEAADEGFDVSIISVGAQPLIGDFVARPLARSAFVLCAAPAYLQRRGRPSTPDDLLQHEGVLPAVAALRRELTLFSEDAARESAPVSIPLPVAALATAHLDTLLAAALAGLGIAGLPSFMASAALRDGRLERVLPGWRGVSLGLHVALPTRRHVPARTRAFVDFLVKAFDGEDRDPWLDPPTRRRTGRSGG